MGCLAAAAAGVILLQLLLLPTPLHLLLPLLLMLLVLLLPLMLLAPLLPLLPLPPWQQLLLPPRLAHKQLSPCPCAWVARRSPWTPLAPL